MHRRHMIQTTRMRRTAARACHHAQVDPGVPWVDSSPSNGVVVDTAEMYVKKWGDPQSVHAGDVHFYKCVRRGRGARMKAAPGAQLLLRAISRLL